MRIGGCVAESSVVSAKIITSKCVCSHYKHFEARGKLGVAFRNQRSSSNHVGWWSEPIASSSIQALCTFAARLALTKP